MDKKPHHLNKKVKINNKFKDTEELYRRFGGNEHHPSDDYFAELKSSKLISGEGISVNRENYCKHPEDVLWKGEIKNQICHYELRGGVVIFCEHKDFSKYEQEVKIYCKHKPIPCNCSHTDIYAKPKPKTKKEARPLKVFLTTIFNEAD